MASASTVASKRRDFDSLAVDTARLIDTHAEKYKEHECVLRSVGKMRRDLEFYIRHGESEMRYLKLLHDRILNYGIYEGDEEEEE